MLIRRFLILLLALCVFFASITLMSCQEGFDWTKLKVSLFNDLQGKANLSHEICPKCAQASALDTGRYCPLSLEVSTESILFYGETTQISKRFGVEAGGKYCPVCGYSNVWWNPLILSFEDFFPKGKVELAKGICR